MSKKRPTQKAIDNEIAILTLQIPRVLPQSHFGDNHPDAIRAQIKVLEKRLTMDEVYDYYDDAASNVRDSAQEACDWLNGDYEDDTLSESWEQLCVKGGKR